MPTYADFVQKYPAYDRTHDIDELRDRDYARLDQLGQVYLDYTGAGCTPNHSCALIRNCSPGASSATRILPILPPILPRT